MKRLRRITLLASLLMTCAALSLAQDRARTIDASHSSSATATTAAAAALDPAYIPHGAKVYVNDIQGMNGFENYLVAAFKKKKVDLLVVADRGDLLDLIQQAVDLGDVLLRGRAMEISALR